MIINITGFLTDFTEGQRQIKLHSATVTVGEALNQLWQMHSGLRDRVLNEQGLLRPHVNIFVDNENIRRKELLETSIVQAREITILPSVTGGTGRIVNGS